MIWIPTGLLVMVLGAAFYWAWTKDYAAAVREDQLRERRRK